VTVKRSVRAEDLALLQLASDAQIAPDASAVAYVVTTMDLEADRYRSAIWLARTDGSPPRRFTSGTHRDTMPRWSPSGEELAFLSDRTGSDQLWVIPRNGGEARQLTNFVEPVTGFAWSPDGQRIAVVTRAQQAEGKVDPETDVVRLTRLRYRFDGQRGFLHERRSHIWVVDLRTGTLERATDGDWEDDWPAWSPDGSQLVFTSNRTGEREWNAASELWLLRFDAAGRAVDLSCVTGGPSAAFGRPSWSPDGRLIAAVGHFESWAGSARHKRLWVMTPDGNERRNLSADFDATLEDSLLTDAFGPSKPGLIWSPDGRWIFTQVSEQGAVRLYRFPVSGGAPECIIGGARRVLDFSLSADGRWIAAVIADPVDPGSVWLMAADGSSSRCLADPNAAWKEEVKILGPEEMWVSSPVDGRPIHAWVLRPANAGDERVPLVLSIHGGPHGMYGWAYCHEFQVLAAAGYGVVYANPRGSQGYGETFLACTRGAWGEADMPDLMAVVDAVLAQGWADPGRLGVCGGSYGGYMTNWIIGHTDRFRAAVSMRCVSELVSMYGTSDIGVYFSEWEIGATPWDDPERYRRLSPLTYAPNIRTPLLLLHAEEDWRCPIAQAEQLFTWLRRLGRTVELVRFPGEGHNLTRSGRPRHRLEHLEHELRWFRTYL
jgi:dipeptidyl aminopeptidase/acylaminoacyl peptidase